MRPLIFLTGAAISLIGIAGLAGIIPLSVLNTVSFSQPNVSCNSEGACSVTFTITNKNATSNFDIYMKVTNAAYQNIWSQTIHAASSSPTVNVAQLSIGTLPPGAYIFNVFAVTVYGVVISSTTSQAFNVSGNYVLTIDPYNPGMGGVSVSPTCAIDPTKQSTCSLPVGTSVTVTYIPTSGYLFGQWCYWYSGSTLPPADGCTISGAVGDQSGMFRSQTNPLTFTMTGNYELVYSVSENSPALNIQYFTVIPTVSPTGGRNSNPIAGTLSPQGQTNIYQPSSSQYGATSVTFTASPNANYSFANWQTNGKNFTANPLTLQYSDLKPLQQSGQVQFYLYAYFKANLFYPLGIGAYAGIITTPAAKNTNYLYPAGASVTVTIANVANNVCFTGWLVDGNAAGSANSVTVTTNQMHNIFAQGVGKPATGCGSITPPPPSGASFIPYIFLVVGGAVMALGLRRKR